jgi:hypothetical protein
VVGLQARFQAGRLNSGKTWAASHKLGAKITAGEAFVKLP